MKQIIIYSATICLCLSSAVYADGPTPPVTPDAVTSATVIIQKIEDLKQLLKEGKISAEEYEKEKNKLIR